MKVTIKEYVLGGLRDVEVFLNQVGDKLCFDRAETNMDGTVRRSELTIMQQHKAIKKARS